MNCCPALNLVFNSVLHCGALLCCLRTVPLACTFWLLPHYPGCQEGLGLASETTAPVAAAAAAAVDRLPVFAGKAYSWRATVALLLLRLLLLLLRFICQSSYRK